MQLVFGISLSRVALLYYIFYYFRISSILRSNTWNVIKLHIVLYLDMKIILVWIIHNYQWCDLFFMISAISFYQEHIIYHLVLVANDLIFTENISWWSQYTTYNYFDFKLKLYILWNVGLTNNKAGKNILFNFTYMK